METIHLFVELLDQYFSNVCELDIVFHFNKVIIFAISSLCSYVFYSSFGSQVYAILDEYIIAGEVQESSKRVILERVRDLETLE
jgi:AP-2 complex subunit sigma-1